MTREKKNCSNHTQQHHQHPIISYLWKRPGTIFTVVRLFFTSLAATSLKLIFLLDCSSTLLVGTGRPFPVPVPGSTGRAFGGIRGGGCGGGGCSGCGGGGGWGSRASLPFPLPFESPSPPRRCASFSQPSCDAWKNGHLSSCLLDFTGYHCRIIVCFVKSSHTHPIQSTNISM